VTLKPRTGSVPSPPYPNTLLTRQELPDNTLCSSPALLGKPLRESDPHSLLRMGHKIWIEAIPWVALIYAIDGGICGNDLE